MGERTDGQRLAMGKRNIRRTLIVLVASILAIAGVVTGADRPAGATVDQDQILADGVVTFEEYTSAVQSTVDCLRSIGFTVSEPRLSEFAVQSYEFEFSSAAPPDSAMLEARDTCFDRHLSRVELGWASQVEVPIMSESERHGVLRECLADAIGVDVPQIPNAPAPEAVEALGGEGEVFAGCVRDLVRVVSQEGRSMDDSS